MQKCLTKGKVYGNICKLSQMRRCKYMEKQMEKTWKKFWKGIDKADVIWYDIQAVARDGAEKEFEKT